jgi:hypothetical protein
MCLRTQHHKDCGYLGDRRLSPNPIVVNFSALRDRFSTKLFACRLSGLVIQVHITAQIPVACGRVSVGRLLNPRIPGQSAYAEVKMFVVVYLEFGNVMRVKR